MLQKQNEAAQCAQVTTNQVINQVKEAAVKFPSLKSEANKEAKEHTRSVKFCLNVTKEMFDDKKDGKMREYILGLGFTAKDFKDLNWQEISPKVNEAGRTCIWYVLTALAQYAKDKDLTGEKAAKEKRKADREAAAEARRRMEARRKADREAVKAAKQAEVDRKNNSAEMLALSDKVGKDIKKANNRQKKANKK